MRRILLSLFAVLLFASAGFAQEASASEKYNSGDYLGAAQIYQAQAEQNPEDPYLLYNLANSYFKSGDTDKALVYYLRSFKLLPRDKDIRHNLAFAMQASGQKLVPDGMPDTVFILYNWFSLPELKGLCALFAWLAALGWGIYFFAGRKNGLRIFSVITTFLFLFFGVWAAVRTPNDTQKIAVVTVPRAELRSGPGDNFPVSLSVPRAHILIVEDSKGEWDRVNLKDSQSSGWVLKKSIEEI